MSVATRDGPDIPSLLPGGLLRAFDSERPVRRSTRDWVVDWVIFVLAVVSVGLFSVSVWNDDSLALWARWLDISLGIASPGLLWFRRRWPVAVALIMVPIGGVSLTAAVAGLITLFTVAVHRRVGISAPIAVLSAATSPIFLAWRPDPDLPYWLVTAFSVITTAAVFAWGMFVRARRQLVVSLHDRAVRAESEQQLRVTQAQHLERARIAREMHDVLAHRISLLSLHAGALEIRPDLPPDEVAKAAAVIRSSAHQALQDLREVIGVLREEDGEPIRPQPTLADVTALIEESRGAGMKVRVDCRVDDIEAVPAAVGRNAYRIVQEGLTNARKHAAGVLVDVSFEGTAGDGLTVLVRNAAPVGGLASIPGAGTGIVGLVERTGLAGGRLTHGRTDTGDFELRAWLPWPA
ncbi:Signal transduction histidine kinase [Asanoa hainanensis]|uniref:histidine kinase n=1 Tax=Asanoa hainanensis TaxID=560556 RepID=A0A239MRW2_9ACTN|nr:histidine kinase [Asanoa hainanensis]SNT44589.1 Signal transduction histidine kinase [Asanoa hainanensis]